MTPGSYQGAIGKLTPWGIPDRSNWISHQLPSGWGNPEMHMAAVRVVPDGYSQTHIMNAMDVDEHGWWEPDGYVARVVPAGRP